jgi:hypothetical protein
MVDKFYSHIRREVNILLEIGIAILIKHRKLFSCPTFPTGSKHGTNGLYRCMNRFRHKKTVAATAIFRNPIFSSSVAINSHIF